MLMPVVASHPPATPTLPTVCDALTAQHPNDSPNSIQVRVDYGNLGRVLYDHQKKKGPNRSQMVTFKGAGYKVRSPSEDE
jgi:hypothetical protein